jgi:hypothetical protein
MPRAAEPKEVGDMLSYIVEHMATKEELTVKKSRV